MVGIASIEKAGSLETAKIRAALEGLKLTSVKGPLEMRACDHQGSEQGFVVKVVRKPDGKGVMPTVIATYPADRVTPPCNKMEYTD